MLPTLATAALLLQQHDTSLAGRVIDVNGRPAAKATVTLLHRPICKHLDPAREHRVVVTTDERGAFRASLHDDAVYSAWAATPSGASDLAEGVAGGEFLELRVEPGSGPRTIAVSGLDAWSDAATFRWRALVGGEHLDFVPVDCRDAKLTLPPLPPIGMQVLEVLHASGEVLHAMTADDAEPGAVQLPPPASYTVRVKDKAGAPLRDVEILAHLRNYWTTVSPGVVYGDRFRSLWPSMGRTDANGELALRVADPGNTLWLLAQKDGFRMSLDGLQEGKRVRAGEVVPADAQPGADEPFAIVLEQAPPQKLTLRLPDEAPIAVDTLFTGTTVWVRSGGSGTGTPFTFALPLTKGEAVLPSPLPAGSEPATMCTVLAPAVRTALGEQLGHAVPPALRLSAQKGVLGGGVAPKLDPTEWRSLHVVAADGRPAARTVVQLSLGDREPMLLLLRTDRLGRVAFPVTAPLRATVFAAAGAGSVEIDKGGERTVTLSLRALVPLTGRVVDAAGEGVADARVSLQIRGRPAGRGTQPSFVENLALERQLAARSASDGRFELLAPPDAMSLGVTARTPDQRGEMTTIAWDPAAPAPVEVRVGSK